MNAFISVAALAILVTIFLTRVGGTSFGGRLLPTPPEHLRPTKKKKKK